MLKKSKHDFYLVDPQSLTSKCAFNDCVDKFTILDHKVINDNGYIKVDAFHKCEECGKIYTSHSDVKRAKKIWVEEMKKTHGVDPSDPSIDWRFELWMRYTKKNKHGE